MSATDIAFVGSIPALYDRCLGPLLFEPYAKIVAERAKALQPSRILETAAGTGIVTAALHEALPDAEVVATDLNPTMLDVAAARIPSDKMRFQAADAQALPFDGAAFDLVACQFGVMFFPNKVQANAEARRVLRDGGRYIAVIWDRLDRNPASRIAHDALAALFPYDPPQFLARTPFGYADPAAIEHDLLAAGFTDIEFETLALKSRPSSPRDAAIGLCQGSPLRSEIEAHGPDALDRATDAVATALEALNRDGTFDSDLSAHLVTAIA